MKSKLFNLDGLEKAAAIQPATILTSLGLVYCSLRRTLPDGAFEEILGQPDAMYKSASSSKLRNYVWETKDVVAELTIQETPSRYTSVTSRHLAQWRIESKDPSLALSWRVGFEDGTHQFSYHDSTGDQAHQGVIWTNEDFIDENAPSAMTVAIAGWFDREVCIMSDKWGIYADYLSQSLSENPTGAFAIASGLNHRDSYPEPEFSGVLKLNENQLFELDRSVDPLG